MKFFNMIILILTILFSVACKQETEEKINDIVARYKENPDYLEEILPTESLEDTYEQVQLKTNGCPNGMIMIAKNSEAPFCVDQFPRDKELNLYDAYNHCKNLNSNKLNSSYFALLSNNEWMQIAREIEGNKANWFFQKIGWTKLISDNHIVNSGEVIMELEKHPHWIDWISTKGLDYYPDGCHTNDSNNGWIYYFQEHRLCDEFESTFAIDEIMPLYKSISLGKIRIKEKHHGGVFDNQGAIRGADMSRKING